MQSPLRWSTSPDWKLDYCNVERITPEELDRRRAEFARGKQIAKSVRQAAQQPPREVGDRDVEPS